ncbi:response regulator transcription factor [Streptomyces sp. NBC_01618]|uniref:response regulator transcription factor n=1 Tax=Streptomyces sp. NBC_01618 TaxID=2975900 RepID=UPI003868B8C4|nr:response regulator transcription factor [Streptomyces sp. NBC_01618]WTE38359.1 response regulator transcription factor [Streptomyces sp. NBC_01618]
MLGESQEILPQHRQQGEEMGINILVSDKMNVSRYALTALLEQGKEIQVVGSVADNLDAIEFADTHHPDVVIFSFDGADGNVITVAEKITGLPRCRCLLLAESFTRSVIRQAFTGGIAGMVQQSASPYRFFESVHRVHQGERVFDTELTVAVLGNNDCPLSQRQLSVLERLAQGDTLSEIAAQLHISDGTVRNYLLSAVTKLGARNRIDALRIAQEAHWI